MVFENLREKLFKICEAIDLCMSKKLITPSLILLYSGMDILGWLEYGDSLKSGQRFRKWVDCYILPLPGSSCDATDLYGARCGLIHTFTPDSDLSKKNKARKIYYAWGTSEIDALNKIITLGNMKECIALKIEVLIEAFKDGIQSFLVDLKKDPQKAQIVFDRAGKIFRSAPKEEITELLNWAKSVLKQP